MGDLDTKPLRIRAKDKENVSRLVLRSLGKSSIHDQNPDFQCLSTERQGKPLGFSDLAKTKMIATDSAIFFQIIYFSSDFP